MNAEPSDAPYLEKLKDVQFRPLFVMGDHRSGTTILYKALGASGCFNIVTAYHVIKYDELLYNHFHGETEEAKARLMAEFKAKGQTDRAIDRMQLSPEMPEEYGFIFRHTGFRQRLNRRTMPAFMELCRKIQLTSETDKPLLLKNPWDYYLNFMNVKRVFPEAKFIFMHRNPLYTMSSQLKALRMSFSARNEYVALIGDWYEDILRNPVKRRLTQLLFSERFNLGLRVGIRHLRLGTRYFLDNVSQLPPDDYVSIRYEDLCRDPNATIRGILDWLDLKEPSPYDYATLIQPRESPLLKEIDSHRDLIARRLRAYFEWFDYRQDQ